MSPGFIIAIVLLVAVGLWGMRKARSGASPRPSGPVVPKPERVPTLDERIALVEMERDPAAARAERRRLAEQCIRAGRTQEAVRLYQAALKSAPDDAALNFGLAHAQFAAKDFVDAATTLERMRQPDGRLKTPEMQLLYARCLEAAEQYDAAKAAYAVAGEICAGEEARCRRAQLLRRTGEPETALALFQEIVRAVAKADPAYARTQREWFEIAKREIGG